MNTELFEDLLSQGAALMAGENYKAAKKNFENALKVNPKSAKGYMHLGNACANLELFDDAIQSFKNALLLEPDNGEALFSIGNAYLLKKDTLRAVEYYNKAEKAGTCRPDMYFIMAGVFMDAGDEIQALRSINKAIGASPLDGRLRLFKVQIYLAGSRYEEALETLDEMEQALPDAFEAYHLRTEIYCGQKNYEKALEICNRALERFPKDSGLAADKLKVLVDWEKDEMAREWLEYLRQQEFYGNIRKEAAVLESILTLRNGDTGEALSVLLGANEALGNDPDLLYLILDIYGKISDSTHVIEISELLLSMELPKRYEAGAKYFHANALEKLGRTQEAQEEYRRLTREFRRMTIEEPGFYEGYIYRLLSHVSLGEYEKAMTLAEYIENLYPKKADAHAFKYHIYKKKGDMDMAEKEKNIVQKINPDFVL